MPSPNTLADAAWEARELSRPRSGVAVGCAILTDRGDIFAGCNLELEFRMGMHAEVNALAQMLAKAPGSKAGVIIIAADRPRFLPCGSCMDWIFQSGIPGDTLIIHQQQKGVASWTQFAHEVMPLYPK